MVPELIDAYAINPDGTENKRYFLERVIRPRGSVIPTLLICSGLSYTLGGEVGGLCQLIPAPGESLLSPNVFLITSGPVRQTDCSRDGAKRWYDETSVNCYDGLVEVQDGDYGPVQPATTMRIDGFRLHLDFNDEPTHLVRRGCEPSQPELLELACALQTARRRSDSGRDDRLVQLLAEAAAPVLELANNLLRPEIGADDRL